MELLRHAKRSHVTEAAYKALNVLLAVAILLVVIQTDSILLPLIIVILSKWRVLAVRPRFWTANILANLVDIIVGLSYVVILFQASGEVGLQVAMTALYIGWLLFIKPRSKRSYVVVQSLVALFLGINALSMVAYSLNVLLFVVGIWIIGFVCARHILTHDEEPLAIYLSYICGLLLAELGWISYHWLFAYGFTQGLILPIAQLSVVATLLGFMIERFYHASRGGNVVHAKDVVMPIVFSVSLILLMVVLFNNITPAGSL